MKISNLYQKRLGLNSKRKLNNLLIIVLLIIINHFSIATQVIARPTWRVTSNEAEAEIHEIELDLYPAHGITIILTEIKMRAIDVFLDDDRFIELQFSPALCKPDNKQCESNGAKIIRLKQKKDIYQFCQNNNTLAVNVRPPQGIGKLPQETPASLKCNPLAHSPDYSTRLTIVAASEVDNTIKVFSSIIRLIFDRVPPSNSLSKLKIVPEQKQMLPTVHLHHKSEATNSD